MCKRSWLFGLSMVLVAGCVEEESEAWGPISFEEYAESVPRDPTQSGVYLFEGDIAMTEEMLREHYEANVAPQARAWVSRASGTNHFPINDPARKMRLTYCVSTDFGADHDDVVASLHRAARDWERAADVNFIHVPSEDDDCASSTAVWFHVVKVPDPEPNFIRCNMSAFGAGALPWMRYLKIYEDNLTQPSCAGTFDGTVRHELGHTLGFQHEYVRSPSTPVYNPNNPTVCSRNNNDDDELLTKLDLSELDQASVMYYSACSDDIGNLKFLTRRDAAAAGMLYNLPKSGWLRTTSGAAVPQWDDFDGQPGSDIFWYEPSGSGSFVFGQPGGLVTTQASTTQALLARHRPFAGLFDSGDLADVLLYTQGTDAMGNAIADDTMLRNLVGTAFTTINNLTLTDDLYVPLLGQFGGSDRADVFFAFPTGGGRLWRADGTGSFFEALFSVFHFLPITTWYTAVSGDFDGDGMTDVFYYHPDVDSSGSGPKSWLWRNNGDTTFTKSLIDHTSAGIQGSNNSPFFYTMTTGDFDGNGAHDILWYSPTAPNNNVVIWDNGPGLAASTSQTAISGDYKVFSGDFNGDGRSDVFWYNQGVAPTDTDKVWLMNANLTHTEVAADVGDHDFLPVLGDYDDDGTADIYWWHSNGPDKVWISDADGTFTVPQVSVDPAGYPVGFGLQ